MRNVSAITSTILLGLLQLGCEPTQNEQESASSTKEDSSSAGAKDKLEVDQSTKVSASEVPRPGPNMNGDDEDKNVVVTAGALALGDEGLTLRERFALLTGGSNYEGVGINYSEVVVEGFKIQIGGITFGKGVFGTQSMSSQQVFNWANGNEKTLEIRDGFNGVVEESASVPADSYDWLAVSWNSQYQLKAYAYFDRDYNGTPDWTLYTSASGLQLVEGALDMSSRTDYSYAQLGSFGAQTGNNQTITIPSEPLVVTDDHKLFVNLFIDPFRCVKAWDGRLGSGGGDPWSVNPPTAYATAENPWNPAHAPTMGFPFNSAMVETNPANPGKPYKVGVPTFALTTLTMFTTASDKREKIRSEIYLGSWTQNKYTPYNTSNFIVLYNEGEDPEIESDDVPFIAAMNGGDGSEHLHIGSVVRHFSVNQDNTFNFYAGFTTGGGQNNTHPEWNDGGYYYNRDIRFAGHRGLDFPRLAVGASGVGKIGNATRCDDEYNYCVPDGANVKSATNGATKNIYLKRVR